MLRPTLHTGGVAQSTRTPGLMLSLPFTKAVLTLPCIWLQSVWKEEMGDGVGPCPEATTLPALACWPVTTKSPSSVWMELDVAVALLVEQC